MDLSHVPQELAVSFPQSQVLLTLEIYVKRNTVVTAGKKSSILESEEAETVASTPPSQIPLTSGDTTTTTTQRRRDLPSAGARRGKSEGKKRV